MTVEILKLSICKQKEKICEFFARHATHNILLAACSKKTN